MVTILLAFIGTNVDGFLCLGAAFAVDPPHNRVRAILVAACGFAVLLAVAFAVSLVIGRLGFGARWFGLVPAAIGVWRLVRLLAGSKSDGDWLSSGASVFSIVLATGADNVAVYAPMFALQSSGVALTTAAAFLVAWLAGCAALAYATPNLSRIHALKVYLEPALAVLFIAIGVNLALS